MVSAGHETGTYTIARVRAARLGGVYVLLAALVTWPLVLHLSDHIPNDYGDPLLVVWTLDWIARHVPLTDTWWNAPQFFPSSGALAFSEHFMGLAPLTTPLILITGNAVLAYNVAFLFAFTLSALAMHVLVRELTGRHDAALIAAVSWGFMPYRMDHTAHLQVIATWWMPVALTGLHLYLRDRRSRWVWLAVGACVLQALSNGYYLVYFPLLVVAWAVWFLPGRVTSADIRRLVIAGGAGLAGIAPFLYGYWRVHTFHALSRPLDAIAGFSADIGGLLTAPASVMVWGWLQTFPRPEGAIFPGAIITVLVLAACMRWRQKGVDVRRGLVSRLLLAVAVAAGGAVVIVRTTGPFGLSIAGVSLFSVSSVDKPFTLALIFAAGALVAHPHMRTAWRTRSVLAFYALAAVLMTTFAFGPQPTLLGETALYRLPAPYALLMELPGLDSLRVPARFWMVASLCLSVAAGLAFAKLSRPRPLAAGILAACIFLEAWPSSLPVVALPDPRPAPVDAVARLHLPTSLDASILYQAMTARRVLVNGHSGNVPRHYMLLERLLNARDPEALATLTTRGPIEVVVERAHDPDGTWASFVSSHPGAQQAMSTPDFIVFRLPATAWHAYGAPAGERLRVASFHATVNAHLFGFLTDDDPTTRWDTGGPQQPGQALRAEFDRLVDLSGLTIEIGAALDEFPRGLDVDVSADGRTWTTVWRGSTTRPALLGTLEAPAHAPLHLSFSAMGVRAVQLRLTAPADSSWSVVGFRAYGAAH